MRMNIASLLILSVVVVAPLMIIASSCGESPTPKQVSPVSTLPPSATTPTESVPQNIDEPKYTSEEISTTIYSKLSSILPSEYRIEQFNRDTRKTKYLGNGKWEFYVFGREEKKESLPEEIIEQSDILWIGYQKDKITTSDLSLTAYYFENSGICEISSIERYNENTYDTIISERTIEAKLTVTHKELQHFGITHRFQVTVKNTSFIPIKGIKLWASFSRYNSKSSEPVEVEGIVYYDELYPDKTAVLIISFEDEDPTHYYRYIDFEFFTLLSGSKIPHT
jgi:hypothetical protein